MEASMIPNARHAGLRSGNRILVTCRKSGEPVTPVFPYLYGDPATCNVNLTCDGETFLKAHKQVLIESSAYFAAKFRRDPELTLINVDVPAHVMKLVLKFMYLGKVSLAAEEELTDFIAATGKLSIYWDNIGRLDINQKTSLPRWPGNETLGTTSDPMTSCVFEKCTNYKTRDEKTPEESPDSCSSSSSRSIWAQLHAVESGSLEPDIPTASQPQPLVATKSQGIFKKGRGVLSKLKLKKARGADSQGASIIEPKQDEESRNVTMPQSQSPPNVASVSPRSKHQLESHPRVRFNVTRQMSSLSLRGCFGINYPRE